MSKRSVVIDDSDTRIQYTPTSSKWFADQGSQDQVGNFGPPFRSTLHGTQASASLSFTFSGTSFQVIGTNSLRNDSGVLDPQWECFIDRISIQPTDPFQYPENNWVFCKQDDLLDGPHTLTVNATVAKKQTFWFDRIHYTPSPGAPLENEYVYVEGDDPALKFGSGWGPLGGSANLTNTKSSTLEFEFTGVSVAWYSFIPSEFPGNATTGSYSVDGGTSQAFNLKGHVDKANTEYNQKFFETPTLPMGRHKLSVTYNGNNKFTPLTLDYLIVQNGTVPVTNSPDNGNTQSGGTSNNKKTNIGAIVGGVVSAVVVIVLIVLAILFFRRRRQRRKRLSIDLHEDDNIVTQVHPFQYQHVRQSSSFVTSPPVTSQTQSSFVAASNATGTMGAHRSNPSSGSRSDLQSSSSVSPLPPLPTSPGLSTNVSSDKAREAMSQRGPLQLHADRPTPRFVHHEDSGVRMQNPELPEEVIDLPPTYTPG